MLYFKNVELAEAQHVSLRTVLNWIKAAQEGKLDLTLHEHGGKTYIANTSRNVATIERLVAERKKFRNSRGHKVITPRPEFYHFYTPKQILDIINNLETYHEIPLQYAYFGEGAKYWDEYFIRSVEDATPGATVSTNLLEMNKSYIDNCLANYKQINIIDVGAGNAKPIKDVIAYLLEKEKLGRYVALDISPEMLRIARSNIDKWFGGRVAFEGYEFDLNHERFDNLFSERYIGDNPIETANWIFLLGGTVENLRLPDGALRAMHDSMGRNDLLFRTEKLDTAGTRRFFDLSIVPEESILSPLQSFVLNLLNIDRDFYDIEARFDKRERRRTVQIRLKVAITIKLSLPKGEVRAHFQKDESILIYTYWHQSDLELYKQLDRNGFHTIQASQTPDGEYILTISRIQSGHD